MDRGGARIVSEDEGAGRGGVKGQGHRGVSVDRGCYAGRHIAGESRSFSVGMHADRGVAWGDEYE